MEHPTYFSTFMNDHVNLDQEKFESLETSVQAIEKAIRNSDYGAKIKYFRSQGSFAHRTIVRPKEGAAFDADMVMVVNEVEDWEPKDYLFELRRVLRANGTYKDKARLSDVCVTLDYVGDKQIDIAPLLQVADDDDQFNICHHRHNQFIRSEPLGFTDWLVRKNQHSGSNSFRKVTRLLKYIRNYKQTFTCPSVLLTTLIGGQIHEADNGSDDFSNIPRTLTAILERLSDSLEDEDDVPEVPNPSMPEEDLGKLWTEAQFLNFKSMIAKYAEWARDALDEQDHNESLKKWRRLLGDEFGAGKDQVIKKSAIVEDSSIQEITVAKDGAHPEHLVDVVVRYGLGILSGDFYRPPYLSTPIWANAGESAQCTISAYFHGASKTGAGRLLMDGEPLPRDGNIRFVCSAFNLQYHSTEYYVKWRVTNTGIAAKLKGQMRGDFYEQEGHFTRWERLAYRGVHFVEAFVIRSFDNSLACKANPFHVVIK